MDDETRQVNVSNCVRCDGAHPELVFKRLLRPVDSYTYWAMCPTRQEPILLEVIEESSK